MSTDTPPLDLRSPRLKGGKALTALRVLVVEDSEDDANIAVRVLERDGFEIRHERVQTARAMKEALARGPWDAVISDYQMPGFTGLQALGVLRASGLDLPFILISGAIGESTAVAVMKAGAGDYVMKNDLGRLAPALRRELKEAANRAAQRAAERALEQSEQRLRTIIGAEPECVKLVSSEGRLVEMNPAGLAMLEAGSLAEVQARPLVEFLLPEHREAFVALHRRVMAGESGRLEFEVQGLKGRRRWLETHAAPLRGADGKVAMLLGITRDITERRQAEGALRATTQQLRMLVDSSPLAIYTRDRDGRVTSWNPAAEKVFGWAASEVLGRPLPTIPQEARAESDRMRGRLLAGESLIEQRLERLRRDGSAVHVDAFHGPLHDEAGRTVGIISVVADVSERVRAERARQESEAGLRHAQDIAGLAHVVVRPDGSYERWSDNWPSLLGLGPERLPGSTRESLELVHPEDRERFRAAAIEAGRSRRHAALEYRMLRAGQVVHLRQIMEPLGAPGADGRSQWFVTIQDITPQKLAEDRMRRLSRVLAMTGAINGAIVRIRERQELFDEACRIAVEIAGFRFAWLCVVDAAAQRLEPVASAGRGGDFLARIAARLSLAPEAPRGHGIAALAVLENRARFVNDIETDPLILQKDVHREVGVRSVAILPIVVGGAPVAALGLHAADAGFFDEEEQHLLRELAGDIAFALDHIEKEEKVRYLAYYDPVTGLANRTFFLERLAQHVAAAGSERRLALAVVNVERFKTINDTFGRHAGDELLRQLGARLAEVAGDAARVARVGADHFAVVMPHFRRDERLAEALESANRRTDGDPYAVAGAELRISTQAGVAIFPNDGADAETLFRHAEAALRKSVPGEHFLFYTPEMTARMAERVGLENKLRQALEREEFVLYYQPKVDVEQRTLTGLEALIRWRSPERGLVPPGEFIPMLEETGLILEVGAWSLRRAALDRRAWAAGSFAPPRVAVNVSAIQLRQANFVAVVQEALQAGAQPAGIDLEITESLVMQDVEGGIRRLQELRRLGVEVAIDDFGTGYSSLAYLARLPVHALKIDRSFIVKMAQDADTMTLVSTVVSLARALRLKVVAEGVDSEEQAKYLRLLRCDEMQGYLISRPVPAEQVPAMLHGRPLP
jgi:PAS domain S-box-containing protein/diguanylate cyclase (GGDEF)-like protein